MAHYQSASPLSLNYFLSMKILAGDGEGIISALTFLFQLKPPPKQSYPLAVCSPPDEIRTLAN